MEISENGFLRVSVMLVVGKSRGKQRRLAKMRALRGGFRIYGLRVLGLPTAGQREMAGCRGLLGRRLGAWNRQNSGIGPPRESVKLPNTALRPADRDFASHHRHPAVGGCSGRLARTRYQIGLPTVRQSIRTKSLRPTFETSPVIGTPS